MYDYEYKMKFIWYFTKYLLHLRHRNFQAFRNNVIFTSITSNTKSFVLTFTFSTRSIGINFVTILLIYSSKKICTTLISLYFKLPIPVKSRKMLWSSSNFHRMFSVPITVVSVKNQLFWEIKLFLFRNNIFFPKMQNHNRRYFSHTREASSTCRWIEEEVWRTVGFL